MKHTPLAKRHLALHARMVPFAGYEMPVSYRSIREEYEAVRYKAGIFDISHMAPFELFGSNRFTFLERITPRPVSSIKSGKMQYNVLLNEFGGIVDDVTLVFTPEQRLWIIANAANRDTVAALLAAEQKKYGGDVQFTPASDYVLLAVQGPQSETYVPLFSTQAKKLYFYENLQDGGFLVMRSGYTGEDGFEILAPLTAGQELWDTLIAAGVTPCGLAARDLLRLEAFYPLYGNELSEELTPASCNLGWLISDKEGYYGRERLLSEKINPPFRTVGFRLLEDGVPRSGYEIFAGDKKAGVVTSGGFSFAWNCGFGLARLNQPLEGSDFSITIRQQRKKIELLEKSPLKGSIKRRPK